MKLMLSAVFAVVLVATLTGSVTLVPVSSANANVAGEWTKCLVWLTDGTQVVPVNGNSSQQACHQAAVRCAALLGSLNFSKYYSSPVIANPPYTRCTA